MIRLKLATVVLASSLALLGCSTETGDGTGSDGPRASPAPTASGAVPATTLKVYLATAKACAIRDANATFDPAEVSGAGYRVQIEPTAPCAEQTMFNSYLYTVPVPPDGSVKLTPGNQPAVTLDVGSDFVDGAVTVYYGREGEGRYKVTVVTPGKTEDVQNVVG
jgi:hypothetical protein